MAAPGLGILGGGIWGATRILGGKIEFHEIPGSPPRRCQNFWPPGFFSIHFFRNFFPDISNFFQTFKNCPGLPKFFTDLPKIFPRPTKNVIVLATFHKFLQFCLSNSDVSTTFGHFSQKSPFCRCGSYTHGSQRLMVSTGFYMAKLCGIKLRLEPINTVLLILISKNIRWCKTNFFKR